MSPVRHAIPLLWLVRSAAVSRIHSRTRRIRHPTFRTRPEAFGFLIVDTLSVLLTRFFLS